MPTVLVPWPTCDPLVFAIISDLHPCIRSRVSPTSKPTKWIMWCAVFCTSIRDPLSLYVRLQPTIKSSIVVHNNLKNLYKKVYFWKIGLLGSKIKSWNLSNFHTDSSKCLFPKKLLKMWGTLNFQLLWKWPLAFKFLLFLKPYLPFLSFDL